MDTDEGALVSVLIPTSDGKFGNYHRAARRGLCRVA